MQNSGHGQPEWPVLTREQIIKFHLKSLPARPTPKWLIYATVVALVLNVALAVYFPFMKSDIATDLENTRGQIEKLDNEIAIHKPESETLNKEQQDLQNIAKDIQKKRNELAEWQIKLEKVLSEWRTPQIAKAGSAEAEIINCIIGFNIVFNAGKSPHPSRIAARIADQCIINGTNYSDSFEAAMAIREQRRSYSDMQVQILALEDRTVNRNGGVALLISKGRNGVYVVERFRIKENSIAEYSLYSKNQKPETDENHTVYKH